MPMASVFETTAIPMLPRALSSNLCSLLPDRIRLCLCAEVELDGGGNVTKSRLVRGYMKSVAKLTYGGVARALGMSDAQVADKLVVSLRTVHSHLRTIYRKLQVGSRNEAARWAAEHRLV